jgi:hypothetical protein
MVRKGNANHDRTDRIFGSPDMQYRLAAIFPRASDRRAFQKKLIIEAKMADTRKALQGNSTTAKQLATMGEGMQPIRAINSVANAATGRLEPMMNHLSRYTNMATQGMTPSVANEILNIGLNRDPRAMMAIYDRAIRQAQEVPASRAALARQLMIGTGAAATGNER